MTKYLYYLVMIFLLVMTGWEFFLALVGVVKHVVSYQWLLYGIIMYFLLRRFKFFSRNEKWLQTASHELTHAVVGLMFMHKIHSLEVKEGSGTVSHSGRNLGNIFISLAPYCLPIVTYLFLIMRLWGASDWLFVFDLFIGFTLAFHAVCFWSQTHLHQTDITRYGYVKSFLFIANMCFFNVTIILLTIRVGLIEAFARIFSLYWKDMVNFWNFVF